MIYQRQLPQHNGLLKCLEKMSKIGSKIDLIPTE